VCECVSYPHDISHSALLLPLTAASPWKQEAVIAPAVVVTDTSGDRQTDSRAGGRAAAKNGPKWSPGPVRSRSRADEIKKERLSAEEEMCRSSSVKPATCQRVTGVMSQSTFRCVSTDYSLDVHSVIVLPVLPGPRGTRKANFLCSAKKKKRRNINQ